MKELGLICIMRLFGYGSSGPGSNDIHSATQQLYALKEERENTHVHHVIRPETPKQSPKDRESKDPVQKS